MEIKITKVSETLEDTLNGENVLCTIEFEVTNQSISDAGIAQGRFLHDVLEDMQIYLDYGKLEVTDEMTNYFKAEMLTLHLGE
jgi:hypothetical protein